MGDRPVRISIGRTTNSMVHIPDAIPRTISRHFMQRGGEPAIADVTPDQQPHPVRFAS